MTFLEALESYLDPEYKIVNISTNGRDDNPHLFTAESLALGYRRNEEINSLGENAVNFAIRCMEIDGLLKRWPFDHGATSWDELIGACVSAWYDKKYIVALSIYHYGIENDFCYNVENPGKWEARFYMARNVMLVPLMRQCAGLPVSPLQQLAWSFGLFLSLFEPKSSTSGKILCDVQTEPMRDAGVIAKTAVSIWKYFMSKQYPNGRRELYQIYFPEGHPLGGYQWSNWDG